MVNIEKLGHNKTLVLVFLLSSLFTFQPVLGASHMHDQGSSIQLLKDGKTNYHIRKMEYLSDLADAKIILEAETVLNRYFSRVSQGVSFQSERFQSEHFQSEHLQDSDSSNFIQLILHQDASQKEWYSIRNVGLNLIIEGQGRGLLFGAYAFIDEFLSCKKWVPGEEAVCPVQTTISIPLPLEVYRTPTYEYREIYSLVLKDQEFLDWHGLHSLDTEWGLWGHSMDKIIPASNYFKKHPSWFALVNGRRVPTQLCYSNPKVLDFAIDRLKPLIEENGGAKYWSISPNDGGGFCECDQCQRAHQEAGSIQGTLLPFVNAIANHFPEQIFSVLAYQETVVPPKNLRPANNVQVLLSTIELNRQMAVPVVPKGDAFRHHLTAWNGLTDRLFIWDYYTQFTNFLAPFPVMHTFSPNLKYYQQEGVMGLFAQMAGAQYEDLYELKTYVLAKLLWNPNQDVNAVVETFLKGYYGDAAPAVQEYLQSMTKAVSTEAPVLSIYGNPLDHANGFLSIEHTSQFDLFLESAEQAVAGNEQLEFRVRKLRLALDFVYLQRARMLGFEGHLIEQSHLSRAFLNDAFTRRIRRFEAFSKRVEVKELAENGLTIEAYAAEWEALINTGIPLNKAKGAKISLRQASVPDFPAKGPETLIDGALGYADFSYNYLCFYGQPLEATIDLGESIPVQQIQVDFLEDLAHWITLPNRVRIEYSEDGKKFKRYVQLSIKNTRKFDQASRWVFHSNYRSVKTRYIRVIATPPKSFPAGIYSAKKIPMIACSEIWVL